MSATWCIQVCLLVINVEHGADASALYVDIFPLLSSVLPAFLAIFDGDPNLICQTKVRVLFSCPFQRYRKYLLYLNPRLLVCLIFPQIIIFSSTSQSKIGLLSAWSSFYGLRHLRSAFSPTRFYHLYDPHSAQHTPSPRCRAAGENVNMAMLEWRVLRWYEEPVGGWQS